MTVIYIIFALIALIVYLGLLWYQRTHASGDSP
jgi:hypothetical protein